MMIDKEKLAHDIAVALLPKAMEETNCDIYADDGNANMTVDALAITEAYMDVYESVLKDLS